MQSKPALRRLYRGICHAISAEERENAGALAAKILSNHPDFKRSRHIACYLSYKQEFNSTYVIKTIWQSEKQCYVPVVSKTGDKKLRFVRYQQGDPLYPNKYSILEPHEGGVTVDANALDMVLLPLVAFDAHGNRLGAGGGYYDQTFEFTKHSDKKPLLFGLAYAKQEAELIPSDVWDIKLDGIVTELSFTKCG